MKFLNKNKVVCLGAHPDDVEYGMSGTFEECNETQFFIIGLPFFIISYSILFQSGFFLAKLFDIIFCFLLSILIVIVFECLNISNFDDFISSENKTKGGDNDNDEKEFIVFPYKIELYFVVTTVIPVVNVDRVFLKFSLFIFFIHFFVKKLNLSNYYS